MKVDADELQKQAESLQKQIEDLRKEKDDIFAKLQRVAADYDNYQKRSAKQITDNVAYEKDKIVKSLLPVLDNFEYILANTSCGAPDETLLKGVKIIYDQMLGVLKVQGVEQIKSAGERLTRCTTRRLRIATKTAKKTASSWKNCKKVICLTAG